MTTDRLRQIHDITDNFFFWQGLRWIPVGGAMLALGAMDSFGFPNAVAVRASIAVALFAGAFWLSASVLGRYYASHFGCVRSDPSRHVVRTSVKWLVVYPMIVATLVADAALVPPVVISGFGFAVAIEAYRQSTGGGRRHYLVATIGLVVFSLLPLFDVVPAGKSSLAPLIGIVGLIYVAGGVLDHRELVRVFSPIPEGRHVASV